MGTIHLTEQAMVSIRELRAEYGGPDWGLRFGITGGGCSGYKYVLEFEAGPGEGDEVFAFDDVRVFVSRDHIDKLQNSTIDWQDDLMSSGFKIDNPQARRQCGCGESVDF